jgi:hypothetical protein
VRRGEDQAQLDHQRALGEALSACRPNVDTLDLPEAGDPERDAGFCAEIVSGRLGVPVRMVSVGPTEEDKVFL